MEKEKFRTVVKWLLFIIYMFVLFYIVFFAESFGRTTQTEYVYNLEPFSEIKRFGKYLFYTGTLGDMARLNIIGNIIAFVPFGIFLPWLSHKKLRFIPTFLYSFSLSLAIELIQLVAKVGTCDVDDIILNSAGGIIGYVIWAVYNHIRHRRL